MSADSVASEGRRPAVLKEGEGPESDDLAAKYQEEIARLKSYLLQIDGDIDEESRRNAAVIDDLKRCLAERDALIERLTSCRSANDDDLLRLEEENDQSRELLRSQDKVVQTLREENANLQSALTLLQANLQNEISIELLEARRKILSLEDRLEKTATELRHLQVRQEERESKGEGDEELLKKLSRDLDSRNYLIDQLNEEINGLKAQRTTIGRGAHQGSEGREGVIDKGYIRSLLLSLAHPPRAVSRGELWGILGPAVGMNEQELASLGLPPRTTTTNNPAPSDDGPSIHQGLGDVWISYLLKESKVGKS